MLSKWRKPWLWARLLLVFVVATALTVVGLMTFSGGTYVFYTMAMVLLPAMLPLVELVLIWELNIPQNLSLWDVMLYFLLGGILSLLLSMAGHYILSNFSLELADCAPLSEEPGKLMAFFLDGDDDPATWARQRAFLREESGMSKENAEAVLDALWQAMDWHRPKPSQPEPAPEKQAEVKVDPKYRREYVDTRRPDSSAEAASPKVDPKYQKEYVDTSRLKPPGQRENAVPFDELPKRPNPAPAGASGPASPVTPAAPPVRQGRSKLIPLLIAAAWIVVNVILSNGEKAGDAMTRIQNGEYPLLIALAVPLVAALFVCAKNAPRLLKGLGVVVLGFAAGYNWMLSLYLLDKNHLNMDLVFGKAAGSDIASILTVLTGLIVMIPAGRACAHVKH